MAEKTAKAKKPVKTAKTTRKRKAVKSAKAPERSRVVYDIDAYSPQKIAARIDAVTAVKAKDSKAATFWLGVNAGVFIALGAQFATLIMSDSGLHPGLTAVVAGTVFCLGLIMVVVAGAELFTGNCMIFIGYMEKRISTKRIFDHWNLSLIGNFVGSLIVVVFIYKAHQFEFYDYMVVVASGFEHLVANMYFIPMGIFLKGNTEVVAAAERMAGKTLDLTNLTWKGFFVLNQFPVLLGNVFGGVVLAGLAFWFIYLRPKLNFTFTIKEDFQKDKIK